jgi:hypothetical protein
MVLSTSVRCGNRHGVGEGMPMIDRKLDLRIRGMCHPLSNPVPRVGK